MHALFLALIALPSWAQQPSWDRVPTGDVTAVVVFPDRAEVTRTVETRLAVGLNEVVFADLPPALAEHTLQARGEGVEGASLLGLDVVTRELAEDRRARVAELEEQVQAVSDRIRIIQDRRAAASQELSFLTQLKAASATQLSAELLFADRTVAKADALASLLRRRVPQVQATTRQADVDERDATAELQALSRELYTVKGASQWARRDVTVQLESPTEGEAAVSLTYVLPGAGWTPTYDVRADLGQSTVQLALSALVTQTTGEDWSDIALTLSTARPAAGVAPPELSPFWLEAGWPEPVVYDTFDDDAYYGDEDDMEVMEEEQRKEEKPARPQQAPLAVRSAAVSERAVATTFEVPGSSAVPGEGTRRKLLVTTVDLPVELVHVVIPRHEEAAFLVGRATWEADWPLLSGRAASFLDGAFVGLQTLAQTGKGGELVLGFGRDDAVQVEVEVLEETTSSPDWLGKVTYKGRWAYTLTSGRDEALSLELSDRVPVSKELKYVVKYLGDEPDEATPEGICTFSRELAPGAEVGVEFGYQVRYPRRSPPRGLP